MIAVLQSFSLAFDGYLSILLYLCKLKRQAKMIVCIAEKPSVAKDIARIMGATAHATAIWKATDIK